METMRLIQALESGRVNIGDYVEYHNDERAILVSADDSGYTEDQMLRNTTLNWRVVRYNGRIWLLGEGVLPELCLSGKRGYEKGIHILNKVCNELYSSNFGISTSLNLDMYKVFTRNMKEKEKLIYWLATVYEHLEATKQFCICLASKSGVYGGRLYAEDGYTGVSKARIRPVVYLKSNVKVNINKGNGSKKSPWKLEIEEQMAISKEKLNQIITELEKTLYELKDIYEKM